MLSMRQATLALLPLLLYISSCQPCMMPNCLSCPNPYICESCQVGKNCCQETCTYCVNQTICQACSEVYLLSSENICTLTKSCLQPACTACTNNTCTMCVDGYTLDPITQQCVQCPQFCEICTPNGTCIFCSSMFFKNALGECQSCGLPACLECNNTVVCTKCSIGTVLNPTYSQCANCPTACRYCATATTCTACVSGYYLSGGARCKPCASGCQQCNGSASNCVSCSGYAYLLNGICINCYTSIAFCISCSMTSGQVTCQNCSAGMYVAANLTTCLSCPPGCSICTNATNCLSCKAEYYLNPQTSICQYANIPNCYVYYNASACQYCANAYYLTSNSNECLPCAANCQGCFSLTSCYACYSGYTVKKGLCVACPLNCIKCAVSSSQCQSCVSGFYVNNGICLPCPSFCSTCSKANCLSCLPNAYLSNKICVSCPTENCASCTQQFNGFINCTTCVQGYYISSTWNNCLPCADTNCSVCTSLSCQLCNSGYYLINGSCLPCLANCKLCLGNQTCLNCMPGYYQNQNSTLCQKCALGCASCITEFICDSCDPRFYLNVYAGSLPVCLACPDYCAACSGPTTCTQCSIGYSLNASGVCDQCEQGFAVCDGIEQLFCLPGYALVFVDSPQQYDASCQKCPAYCTQCSAVALPNATNFTLQCSQCQYPYMLLTSGNCFLCGSTPQTQGCATCTSTGTCTSCYSGYLLQNGSCVNNNYIEQEQASWRYIGADIGLGCLFVILIIVLLYQKLSEPNRKIYNKALIELTEEK